MARFETNEWGVFAKCGSCIFFFPLIGPFPWEIWADQSKVEARLSFSVTHLNLFLMMILNFHVVFGGLFF